MLSRLQLWCQHPKRLVIPEISHQTMSVELTFEEELHTAATELVCREGLRSILL